MLSSPGHTVQPGNIKKATAGPGPFPSQRSQGSVEKRRALGEGQEAHQRSCNTTWQQTARGPPAVTVSSKGSEANPKGSHWPTRRPCDPNKSHDCCAPGEKPHISHSSWLLPVNGWVLRKHKNRKGIKHFLYELYHWVTR